MPDDSLFAPLTPTGQSEPGRSENHLDSQGLSRLRHQLQAVHIGGALTLDSLLQYCFILSNGQEPEPPLLKQLLDWIAASAEISVLKNFFSIKSHTVLAVWEALMKSAINLKRQDVVMFSSMYQY
ncbi:hypothetical protein PFICI_11148 [Pestalotiopsis fici W106-1]|uniref:Uncharacterized protein n=1 Tax=Pestalotiopsis fici (strain W106-1 / CGMCC3.15140) TaxID=1229662 RepID=W3WU12_PESFW|nr:uncharacterized protein PFICI_11148 [Pestalotiopsis fici W106-1]ETS77274.1 hypothetical protein PFICI_11148 [Pestalotiopsis fici W106-1]